MQDLATKGKKVSHCPGRGMSRGWSTGKDGGDAAAERMDSMGENIWSEDSLVIALEGRVRPDKVPDLVGFDRLHQPIPLGLGSVKKNVPLSPEGWTLGQWAELLSQGLGGGVLTVPSWLDPKGSSRCHLHNYTQQGGQLALSQAEKL